MVAPDLSSRRVLIVHEWLYTWAGAERCLEQILAIVPHADVLVGTVSPSMRHGNVIARRARESWMGRIPFARRYRQWLVPLQAVAFSSFDTSEYDLVISVSHALGKAVKARKHDGVHLCYCLTPPRYVWDLSHAHAEFARPMQRLALRVGRGALRAVDRAAARGVDRFVSISHTVADRVRRAYGRESTVIFPPVAAKPQPQRRGRKSFLLSIGRLVPYKRVDLAIMAAEQLKLPLVVAGDGPERHRLEQLAGPHTEFRGMVSEEEAGELLSTCAAFVFCAEEDFGIAPLEANAHGAPVVAYAQGAVLETFEDGRTSVMYSHQSVASVASAIERCLRTNWEEAALRENAARFAPDRFRDAFRRELVVALEGKS